MDWATVKPRGIIGNEALAVGREAIASLLDAMSNTLLTPSHTGEVGVFLAKQKK